VFVQVVSTQVVLQLCAEAVPEKGVAGQSSCAEIGDRKVAPTHKRLNINFLESI